jgi:circadian clock protein KaiC
MPKPAGSVNESAFMRHQPSLLTTGVDALDQLLGGGIPARQMLIIGGQPGSGKTLLAGQIAFAQAARGVPVLLATAASEPHSRLLESFQSFSFFQRERVGRDIFLLSVHPWLKKGARETRDMLLGSVRERKARLLVFDGLRAAREALRGEHDIREFLAELGIGLASADCTAIFTLEGAPDRIMEMPEASTVDAVLSLSHPSQVEGPGGSVEVLKVRGRLPVMGPHVASFGPEGLRVFRRLETLPTVPRVTSEARMPLGIAGLDEALGGGVQAGTVTLVSGDEGTGKSILAAALARGAGPTLYASGDPRGGTWPTGNAAVWSRPRLEAGFDELAHCLLAQKAELGAERVVVDDIDLLFGEGPHGRAQGFWSALLGELCAGGSSVLLTWSRGRPLPAGLRADNHLELRRVEHQGSARTELWVRKAQGFKAPQAAFEAHLADGRVAVSAPRGTRELRER